MFQRYMGKGTLRSIFSKFVLNIDHFSNFPKRATFPCFSSNLWYFNGISHKLLANHFSRSNNVEIEYSDCHVTVVSF